MRDKVIPDIKYKCQYVNHYFGYKVLIHLLVYVCIYLLFNTAISSPDYIVLIGKDMEGSSHVLVLASA